MSSLPLLFFLAFMVLEVRPAMAEPTSSADKTQTFQFQKDGDRSQRPETFNIEIKGRSDGPMYADPPGAFFPWRQTFYNNIAVSIENKGKEIVRNPWITKVGGVNFFSMDTILASLITPGMSDKEKARAIYELDQKNRFHDTPQNGDNLDPVKYYNVYGYGICGDDATALTALYQRAGLKTRAGWPMGHSTVEVFYDNAWRLLDGDLSAIALKEDNATIASEEDFARDPWLLARTHTYGFKNYSAWDANRDAFAAALQWYLGGRGRNHAGPTGHTMAFDLRPGEKITWLWEERRKPVGNLVLNPKRDFAGKHFHGCWEFELRKEAIESFRSGDRLVVPFKLPYPIVGAAIDLKGNPPAMKAASISRDGKNFTEANAEEWRKGIADDDWLKRLGLTRNEPPPYAIWFGFPLEAANAIPIRIKLDFQAAPKSLPQLTLGDNRFVYADASPQRDVEVIVKWRENHKNSPPNAPAPAPRSPAPDAKVRSDTVTFEWPACSDPDGDKIVDCQFVLSETPDCAHPLSSNFHALLSETAHKGATQFTAPQPGLLNPSQKYYWRVRARDEHDCWGPWSPIWSFEIEAPGAPQPADPEIDGKNRCVKLRWSPAATGAVVKQYRVYGSDYRGFAPHREPYQALGEVKNGEQKFIALPANFLFDADKPERVISLDDPQNVRAFYRIQGVDANGVAGGFSRQIELPGPVLLSREVIKLQPGQVRVPLSILSSAGRLANIDANGYSLATAFQDAWRVEMISPNRLETARREPACIWLAKPLEQGREVKARVKVSGASYYNREARKEFDLTLVGGGPGDWSAEPAKPPVKSRALLKMDFAQSSLEQDPKIKMEEPGFVLRAFDKQQALSLARLTEGDRGYARAAGALDLTDAEKENQAGVKGKIVVNFSLFWDNHERNCRHEIQLLQKDNQWTYLTVAPWNVVTIAQNVKGKGTVTQRSPVSFNYPYGELAPFRWEIGANGNHQVFQGDKLLFETKEMPGRDGFVRFRAAAIINHPNRGSMGFGPVTIEKIEE
ncbi:MAG: transglutaminase domain-containing protein [Verrucomicrobia bacterium]|nr:transglutaminase domain-containing protein [Verrucomicrobiota bacterium]